MRALFRAVRPLVFLAAFLFALTAVPAAMAAGPQLLLPYLGKAASAKRAGVMSNAQPVRFNAAQVLGLGVAGHEEVVIHAFSWGQLHLPVSAMVVLFGTLKHIVGERRWGTLGHSLREAYAGLALLRGLADRVGGVDREDVAGHQLADGIHAASVTPPAT